MLYIENRDSARERMRPLQAKRSIVPHTSPQLKRWKPPPHNSRSGAVFVNNICESIGSLGLESVVVRRVCGAFGGRLRVSDNKREEPDGGGWRRRNEERMRRQYGDDVCLRSGDERSDVAGGIGLKKMEPNVRTLRPNTNRRVWCTAVERGRPRDFVGGIGHFELFPPSHLLQRSLYDERARVNACRMLCRLRESERWRSSEWRRRRKIERPALSEMRRVVPVVDGVQYRGNDGDFGARVTSERIFRRERETLRR